MSINRPYNPRFDFNRMYYIRKCPLNKLKPKSQLDEWYEEDHIVFDNRPTSLVITVRNAPNSNRVPSLRGNAGVSVLKICNIKHKDKKKMNQSIMQVWRDWTFVYRTKILEYYGIYYDKQKGHLIIEQSPLDHSLSCFIKTNGPIKSENEVKKIMFDVLDKIWIIHNNKLVHCDIKPGNIMERNKPWCTKKYILNGWKVIDFGSMVSNNSKHEYSGTIGWTAPEIDYNSKTNIYTYSCDMFSFGLVILYSLLGSQPLQLPKEQRLKYKNNNIKDVKYNILRHQIHSNWYYESVKNCDKFIKNYLIKLVYNEKISLSLFKLLHDGLLVYEPTKRMRCAQVYNCEWFNSETERHTK
eukprot:472152_1